MGDSQVKAESGPVRGQSAHCVNVQAVIRSAEAILAVDFNDVVLHDRVPQVVVGLCRAAAAQSKVVATLTAGGMAASAAPNRRLFLEAAIRLHWLNDLSREDRRRAADIMLDKDRSDTNATLKYLQTLGHEVDFDPTEMNEFELDAPMKGSLQEQARKLDAAVRASSSEPWSLYAMWREETKYAHPSGALAGQYAPTFDDTHISFGEPDPMDVNLEAHRLIQHIVVMTTGHLLADEGFSDQVAGRIPAAFLGAS